MTTHPVKMSFLHIALLPVALTISAVAWSAEIDRQPAAPITELKNESPPPAPSPVQLEKEAKRESKKIRPAKDAPAPPEVTLQEEPVRHSATDKPPAIPEDADVRVIQRDGTMIEEYRVKGRLVMSKVTPKHGVPYYLHYRNANTPPTQTDQADKEFRVPMWRIGSF